MDWTGCELVEVIPGKVSGAPLVRGTRIPADFIVDDAGRGRPMAAILDDFPSLSAEVVERLLEFAHERQAATAA